MAKKGKKRMALSRGAGVGGRKGVSIRALIFVCLAVAVVTINTFIKWVTIFPGSGLSGATSVQKTYKLLLFDQPPAVNDTVSPISVRNGSILREAVLTEPDVILADTILKYFFDVGCFAMRNPQARNVCQQTHPRTQLDLIVKNVIQTYQPWDNVTQRADTLVFNIRHPVDRVVTWFKYVHPNNCPGRGMLFVACLNAKSITTEPDGWSANFFKRCFPTIDRLAEAFSKDSLTRSAIAIDGTRMDGNMNQKTCREIAHDLLQSGLPNENMFAAFMAANMRYFYSKTVVVYPTKDVWVIRTEHVLDDLNDLELLLGGKEGMYDREYAANLTEPVKELLEVQLLPKRHTKLLCCAMQDEFAVINDVFHLAKNFNNFLKYQAWKEYLHRCSFSSWEHFRDECRVLTGKL